VVRLYIYARYVYAVDKIYTILYSAQRRRDDRDDIIIIISDSDILILSDRTL